MIMTRCHCPVLLKISAASLALAVCAMEAGAATFSAIPAADAFVTTGGDTVLSGNNYGGAGALAVSGAGLPKGEQQSAMQFDLSGALSSFNSTFGAGQWSVASVTLQLTATSPNNAIFNTSAAGMLGITWMQNDSWQEGGGTPSSPGGTGITFTSLQGSFTSGNDESLGAFAFSGGTSGVFTYTLGLTSGFMADVLAGGSVSLRLRAADGTVSGVFNSRSFGTAASRPTLTIVAVPEAGTAVFLSGCALVPAMRRRRRAADKC